MICHCKGKLCMRNVITTKETIAKPMKPSIYHQELRALMLLILIGVMLILLQSALTCTDKWSFPDMNTQMSFNTIACFSGRRKCLRLFFVLCQIAFLVPVILLYCINSRQHERHDSLWIALLLKSAIYINLPYWICYLVFVATYYRIWMALKMIRSRFHSICCCLYVHIYMDHMEYKCCKWPDYSMETAAYMLNANEEKTSIKAVLQHKSS